MSRNQAGREQPRHTLQSLPVRDASMHLCVVERVSEWWMTECTQALEARGLLAVLSVDDYDKYKAQHWK